MTVAILAIYKISNMFQMQLKLSSLVFCGIFALIINFLSITVSPFLDQFRFVVLGVMILISALITTGYNKYMIHRRAQAEAQNTDEATLTSVITNYYNDYMSRRKRAIEQKRQEAEAMAAAKVEATASIEEAALEINEEPVAMPSSEPIPELLYEPIVEDEPAEVLEPEPLTSDIMMEAEPVSMAETEQESSMEPEFEPEADEAEPEAEPESRPETAAEYEEVLQPEEALEAEEPAELTATAAEPAESAPEAEEISEEAPEPEAETVSEDAPEPEAEAVSEETPEPEAEAVSKEAPEPEDEAVSEEVPEPEPETISEEAPEPGADEETEEPIAGPEEEPPAEDEASAEPDAADETAVQDEIMDKLVGFTNLDDMLDFAFELKGTNDWTKALATYEYALKEYADDAYAPMLVIEMCNIHKDSGQYQKAIDCFKEALTLPAVAESPDMMAEFEDSIAYLEATYSVLQENNQGEIPFYDIPQEYMSKIESIYNNRKSR